MITKPLLATNFDVDKLRFPLLCTPKLDGIRALALGGKLLSRNFKPIPNNHIRTDLEKTLPNGFDGEVMLRNPEATFQEITSAVMSVEGTPDYLYYAFDYVFDHLNTPYHRRIKAAMKLFDSGELCNRRVRIVRPRLIRTMDELEEFEAICLDKGFEGVMIRDPEGKYKCGRSTVNEGILLKVKRFEDAEAEILDFEEKQKNNNTLERDELGRAKRSTAKAGKVGANTLGAFVVRDVVSGVEFSVGSGLNDDQRRTIWYNREKYYRKVIKYKFQPHGVNPETGVPRFPTFIGFRDKIDF